MFLSSFMSALKLQSSQDMCASPTELGPYLGVFTKETHVLTGLICKYKNISNIYKYILITIVFTVVRVVGVGMSSKFSNLF